MIFKTVGIIGAGAWGTALATNVAHGGKNVVLWSFDGEYAHFENAPIPDNITIVTNPQILADTDVWLIVTPAAFFCETLHKFAKFYKNQPIIICTKGIDAKTNLFMSEILKKEIPQCQDFGVLSGPQFATGVANGEKSGSTLAGTTNTLKAGRAVLNFTYLDETSDIIGTQIAGVGKNIMALIAGFISVKIKSENERAMVFTCGYNELVNIGIGMGAKTETFLSFCGLGDLFLSATSISSRNYAGGVAIANGHAPDGTVEGLNAFNSVIERAKELGVPTPILSDMYKKMGI